MDVALTFDFDAEEVWIGEDPANAGRPGVLSQGTYGAKVAVPLILELLERHGVRATFFVPGRVGERHPGRVREILAAGHEVALHGYTHRSRARRGGRGTRPRAGGARGAGRVARGLPLPLVGVQPEHG
jgi:polysaccharide deacetylase